MNLNENLSTEELVGKMIENLDILEEFLKAFPIKEESIEVEDHIAKYERPEGYPQKLIALEEVVEKASEEFEAVMRANAESEKKLLAKSMFLLERVASCKKRIIASSENYIEQRKAFVNKILKVENGSASVKWENFFDACESHTTEDDAGWDVVDFLRAIGILTTESNGYWLNLGNGEIKPISSKRRHYSFKEKGDAFFYAEYYYEHTKRIRYGICRVSEYVHPCELRI
jgi:hypothetical protein